MDHALSSRAPQTGPPPSPDWSLHQTSSSETASGFAHYGVLDAVGVRLGTVSGWVRTPDGQVAGLCVELRGFSSSQSYLVPLGYVTGVDPRHRTIHLREVTRRILPRMAAPCDRSLPPREVLEAVQREAPEARPEIQSIFRQPERGPLFTQDTPVVVTVKRGDGNRPAHPPVASAPPADKRWRALQQLMIPAWQPLQALGSTPAGGDEGEPRWL